MTRFRRNHQRNFENRDIIKMKFRNMKFHRSYIWNQSEREIIQSSRIF